MPKQDVPPLITSSEFLELKENANIISFNGKFYKFDKLAYKEFKEEPLKRKLIQFLENYGYYQESKIGYVKNMMMCLDALTNIEGKVSGFNQWIQVIPTDEGFIFATLDGLLYMSKDGDIAKKLLPHTPKFFNKSLFPVRYKEKSVPKRFISFLQEVLPDRDVRIFIQEFFGYCLTHDTEHAKMLFFYGSGANGKSVLLLLLKLLVGTDNYSALPFESFYNGNRFLLGKLEGKTVNIYEEIPEDRKIKTDALKNIVTGGEFTAEEKFQPARIVKSTAKLLFATNTLPTLADRSEGIYRRLVVIPFLKQFLLPQEQDTRLSQESYWIESGELDGIFCWALDGLSRLLQRGHFIEPQSSIDIKEQFRLEQNQERQFLHDFFEFTGRDSDRVSSYGLYQVYKSYCEDFGIYKGSAIKLGQEVKRTFPSIRQTKNPVMTNENVKSRQWIGIRVKQEHTEQRN